MVSMVAFQAVDPGSIPGHRILNFYFMKNKESWFIQAKINIRFT